MDDLENLNYYDLRNIAKKLGIKGNRKADKLIRDIRKIQGDGSSPKQTKLLKPKSPSPPVITGISTMETANISTDDEIIFVPNPQRTTSNIDDSMEDLMKHNISVQLKDAQEELDKLNTEHNQTVGFEDLEEAVENKGENEENNGSVLNTTYEVLPDVPEPEDETTENNADLTVEKNDSVHELIDVMKPEMTDEERKEALMAALSEKVKNKKPTSGIPLSTSKEFDKLVNGPESSSKKSNSAKLIKGACKKWGKIHEKMFQNFDSIDVYLEKKTQRFQKLTTPVPLAKRLSKRNKNVSDKKCRTLPQSKIPKLSSQTTFSPKVTSVKNVCFKFTNSASKPPKSAQKVKETSTKASSTKKVPSSNNTDCRAPFMSPNMNDKKAFSPFNFTANKSIQSNKRKFDLQASLSKPVSWKTHKGSLRPVAVGDVEPQYFKKGLQTSIDENRKHRRQDIAKGRTTRRENLLNARRNIVL